jgi:tRNA pseudouridine38-40 synthase
VALGVAYDGTDFAGFAPQTNGRAVADVLGAALARLLRCPGPVGVKGAARTDAGVHALGQVAVFDPPRDGPAIPIDRLPAALAPHLPEDLAVWGASAVPAGWDPVREATGKTYVYRILLSPYPCPLRRRVVWRVAHPLEVARMTEAAEGLLGRRDFAAFRSSGGSARSSVRTLRRLNVALKGDEVRFTVEADGFLYRMVRNLVGTLVEIGAGRAPIGAAVAALESRDRRKAGPAAPPQGLCLMSVHYGLTPPIARPYLH